MIGLLVVFAVLFMVTFGLVSYASLAKQVDYVPFINKYADENGLDPLLVASVINVESGFNPKAKSQMDARGLMQILPDTGKWIAERMSIEYEEENLFDPEYNIRLGTHYLDYLIDHFGDLDLAIAAYNGGIGNVQKWLEDRSVSTDGENLHNIPFEETNAYVRKVKDDLALYKLFYKNGLPGAEISKSPIQLCFRNYGITLKAIAQGF